MISFIDEHREVYRVEPICRVLPIAPSTDYAHMARRADQPPKNPERCSAVAVLNAVGHSCHGFVAPVCRTGGSQGTDCHRVLAVSTAYARMARPTGLEPVFSP